MQSQSQEASIAPPPVQHKTKPSPPMHVVKPTVNPLLPAPVRSALERYPVVVVGTYDPESPVQNLTLDEARAGAEAAHLPFVAVSLLDDRVAGPLTALLPSGGLLPEPGFLVYKRPGNVVFRSDGFLNRMAVAQVVKDAK
jgi:hypothetical protein